MPKVSKTNKQIAEAILANCIEKPELGGCLIWQGRLDDNGYGRIKHQGRDALVHRLVALYHIDRPEEAVYKLSKMRIVWDCGHTICMSTAMGHMHFAVGKPEKVYESADIIQNLAAEFSAGFVAR